MMRGNDDKYSETQVYGLLRTGKVDNSRGAWVLFKDDNNLVQNLSHAMAQLPKKDVDIIISLLETTLKSPAHTQAIGVKLRELIQDGDSQKLIGFLTPIDNEVGNLLKKRQGIVKYYLDNLKNSITLEERRYESNANLGKDSLSLLYIPIISAYTKFMTGNAYDIGKYNVDQKDFVNIHNDYQEFSKAICHVFKVAHLLSDKIQAANPGIDIKRFYQDLLKGIEIIPGNDNTVRFDASKIIERLSQLNSKGFEADISTSIRLIQRETERLNQHQESLRRVEPTATAPAPVSTQASAGILLALAAANPSNIDPTTSAVQALQERQTNTSTGMTIETPTTSDNIVPTVPEGQKVQKTEDENLTEVRQNRI